LQNQRYIISYESSASGFYGREGEWRRGEGREERGRRRDRKVEG
jgi:hypothetical protein